LKIGTTPIDADLEALGLLEVLWKTKEEEQIRKVSL
jgi:hypothetical protein